MNDSDERWERMQRTMEFLLESDAKLSARLDTLAGTVAGLGDLVAETRADVHEIRVDMHEMRSEIRDIRVETREAITRMIEIAEGMAETTKSLGLHVVNHESRIRRLEDQVPPDVA